MHSAYRTVLDVLCSAVAQWTMHNVPLQHVFHAAQNISVGVTTFTSAAVGVGGCWRVRYGWANLCSRAGGHLYAAALPASLALSL